MDAVTLSDEKVRNAAKQFSVAKLDKGKNREDVEKLKIETLPTVVFLAADGATELHRVEGYQAPEAFLQDMEAALKKKPGDSSAEEQETAHSETEQEGDLLAQGKQKAARLDKPLLVKVGATW